VPATKEKSKEVGWSQIVGPVFPGAIFALPNLTFAVKQTIILNILAVCPINNPAIIFIGYFF
jgi:hypothetical protein